MAGRQSMEVTKALRWLNRQAMIVTADVRAAAKRFKVHETTLWRALGKMNHRRETK